MASYRRVRTAQGAKFYGQPIGTIIKPDVMPSQWAFGRGTIIGAEGDEVPIRPPDEDAAFEVLPPSARGESGDGRYGSTRLWGRYGAAGVLLRVEHYDEHGPRYMLVRRGPGVSRSGYWQLPGGARDEKENEYQAIAREMEEETGFPRSALAYGQPVGEHLHEDESGWTYTTVLADLPSFTVDQLDRMGLVVDGYETDKVQFFTPGQIEDLIRRGQVLPELAEIMRPLIEHMEGRQDDPAVWSSRETIQRGDFRGLKRISGQQGSHPGALYEARDGSRWYIKVAPNEEHGRSEVLASALYRQARVDVPTTVGVDEGKGAEDLPPGYQIASAWIEPEVDPSNKRPVTFEGSIFGSEQMARRLRREMREGFAIDVLLGNWDVAGVGFSNIVLDRDGHPIRIDFGGALDWRALGAPKGHLWNDEAVEWQTLRDQERNPYTSQIFGRMTVQELATAIEKLKSLLDSDIERIVRAHGGDDDMIETLRARRKSIMARFKAELAAQRTKLVGGTEGEVPFDERVRKAAEGRDALRAIPFRFQELDRVGGPSRASMVTLFGGQSHRFEAAKDTVEKYSGAGYIGVNNYLRGYTKPSRDDRIKYEVQAEALDSVLEWSTTDRPIVVYRGIGMDLFTDMAGSMANREELEIYDWPEDVQSLVGLTWRDKGFSSTTTDPEIAGYFGRHTAGGMIMRMVLPEGTHALGISGYEYESEVLLERDITYRVVAVHEDKTTRIGGSDTTPEGKRILTVDVELVFNRHAEETGEVPEPRPLRVDREFERIKRRRVELLRQYDVPRALLGQAQAVIRGANAGKPPEGKPAMIPSGLPDDFRARWADPNNDQPYIVLLGQYFEEHYPGLWQVLVQEDAARFAERKADPWGVEWGVVLEVKDARYVRTPAGAKHFGQPIGTRIVSDPEHYRDPEGHGRRLEAQLRDIPKQQGVYYHAQFEGESLSEDDERAKGHITLTQDPVEAAEYLRGNPGQVYPLLLADDAKIAGESAIKAYVLATWPDERQRAQVFQTDKPWEQGRIHRFIEDSPLGRENLFAWLKEHGYHGITYLEGNARTTKPAHRRRTTILFDQTKLRSVQAQPDEHGVLPPRPGAKFEILKPEDRGASGDGRYRDTQKWGKYGAAGVLVQVTAPGPSTSGGGEETYYLLVTRGPGISRSGTFQLPGGAGFEHEDPYQVAAREMHEEIRFNPHLFRDLKPEGESVYDSGDGWQYTTVLASLKFDDAMEFINWAESLKVDGHETGDVKLMRAPKVRELIKQGKLDPNLSEVIEGFIERMEGGASWSDRESVLSGDFRGLKRIDGRKGSHAGGLYQAADGSKWYIKVAPNEEHGRSEVLASDLYRLAGVSDGRLPRVVTSESGQGVADLPDGTQVASEWLDHMRPLTDRDLRSRDPAERRLKAMLREDFAADVWLANWDVGGSNIIVSEAMWPYRIDYGGALQWRALGEPKGRLFTDAADEWQTLRDPDRNPYSSAIFGGMGLDELTQSVHKLLTNVDDADIRERVAARGFLPDLAERLIARKRSIVLRLKAERDAHRASRVVGTRHEEPFQERLDQAVTGKDALRGVPLRIYDRESNRAIARLIDPTRLGNRQTSNYYDDSTEVERIYNSLNAYAGTEYEGINRWLRSGETPVLPDKTRQRIEDLDIAMTYSVLDRDIVTYRGVNGGGILESLDGGRSFVFPETGFTFHDAGYGSTSPDLKVAMKFAGLAHLPDEQRDDGVHIILRMVVPKGAHAIGMSSWDNEAEMLLERDVTYRVVNVGPVEDLEYGFGSEPTKYRMVDVELTFNHDPSDPTYPEATDLVTFEADPSWYGGDDDE